MIARERLGGCLFLGLSLFYGAQISDIQQLPVDALEAMNARSMPILLCGAGVLLSLALIVAGGTTRRNAPDSGADTPPRFLAVDVFTVGLLLLGTVAYAYLLQWVGFWLATFAFLASGFLLLGERRLLLLLVIALLIATLLWVLLRFGLGLYLPSGSLWGAP